MFPTAQQVRARVEACKAVPALRSPSNDYCLECMEVGLAHCCEVEYCGARRSYDLPLPWSADS